MITRVGGEKTLSDLAIRCVAGRGDTGMVAGRGDTGVVAGRGDTGVDTVVS